MPAAFLLTVTFSARSIAPPSIASHASSIVMILVTLATGRFSSALISNMICPLSGSSSSAAAQFSFIGAFSSAPSEIAARAGTAASISPTIHAKARLSIIIPPIHTP